MTCEIIKPSDMTAEQVVTELALHGSEDDPIRYEGRWTTPRELHLHSSTMACMVEIGYTGGPPDKCKQVERGRLSAMLANRRRLTDAGGHRAACARTGPKRQRHRRSKVVVTLNLTQLEALAVADDAQTDKARRARMRVWNLLERTAWRQLKEQG